MDAGSPDLEALLRQDGFVRAVCRALVGSGADAEDAAQDAWVRVLSAGVPVGRASAGFMRAVARSAVFSRHRRDAARARRDRVVARTAGVEVPSPEEILAREELRRQVVEAVLALPEEYRTPVLLRHFQELEPERIAARLGVPVRTVWTRLHRARQRLRESLDTHDPGRRSGLLVLAGAPSSASSSAAAAAGVGFAGGLLMGKSGFVAAAAVLVLGTFVALREPGDPTPPSPKTSTVVAAAESPDEVHDDPRDVVEPPPREEAQPSSAAAVRGLSGRVLDERGAPVADAVIVDDRDSSRSGRSVRSDSVGRFTLEDLPAGGAIRVTHADFVDQRVVPDRDREVVIVLERGVAVRGVVREQADASPIVGAKVRVGASEVVTAADGTFRLAAPARSTRLTVSHPGFVDWTVEPFEAAPADLLDVRLPRVEDAGLDERFVRVLAGEDDAPLLAVRFEPDTARPLGDGLYRVAFERLPGRVRARVHADSRIGVVVEEESLRGKRAEAPIVVRLEHPTTLAGRVFDASGAPIAGAVVSARVEVLRPVRGLLPSERADVRATSDAAGRFALDGLPAGSFVRVRAAHERFASNSVQVRVEPDAPDVELVLDGGRSLSGIVVDVEDGRPIAGAEIRVGHGTAATSDEHGRFSVTGIDGTPRIEVVAVGYGRYSELWYEEFGAARDGRLRVVLERGLEIRGRVVDRAGVPVPRARVRSFFRQSIFAPRPANGVRRSSGERRTVADEEGRFTFSDLAPGPYALSAAAPGLDPSTRIDHALEVEAGALSVTLVARGPTGVALRVVDDATGEPLIRFRYAGPEGSGTAGNANGTQFVAAPAGIRFVVAASAPGHGAAVTGDLELAPGEVREVDLRLPHATSGRGVLRDASGAPLAGARLTFRPAVVTDLAFETFDEVSVTDADGRFVLPAAVPGTFDVLSCAVAGTGGAVERGLAVEPARISSGATLASEWVLVARPPASSGFVRGFVTLRRAAEGAFVVVEPGGLRVPVDAEGRFSVEGVPAGTAEFRLEEPTGHPVFSGIFSRRLGTAEVPAAGTVDVDFRTDRTDR